eukprot:COSAG05_NODE_150_length_16171_cov_64.740356_14_plen_84_part_00
MMLLLLLPVPQLLLAATAVAAPSGALQQPNAINTSLATIPTGYFGGSGSTSVRSDAAIAALAQQRVIVIEKWYVCAPPMYHRR